MHSFIVTWRNNYGMNVIVINTETFDEAEKIAEEKTGMNHSCIGGFDINELDVTTKGVVFQEGS